MSASTGRQRSLGIQADYTLGLSVAGQEGTMGRRVERWVCGLPCKQHSGLQRERKDCKNIV